MRLYFYHQLNDPNLNQSVNQKVLKQCYHLEQCGLDVRLFLILIQDAKNRKKNEALEIDGYSFISLVGLKESNMPVGIIYKLRRQWELRGIYMKLIDSASPSDVIYSRHPYPLFYLLFPPYSKNKRKCKLVFEHNTIEPNEYKLLGKTTIYLLDYFIGGLMRKRADAIVGVTNEITSYEVKRSGNPKKPHITIGNGFDVASVPLSSKPQSPKNEFHLLCVANVSRWHGLDRLLLGLATYRGTKQVILHIVGSGSELTHLQKLADDLGISDRVIFHGFLTGKPLDTIFDLCHVAVGSLGIHRIGINESSILKSREYCARGIPFIIANYDADFPPEFPYVLRFSADESPIDLEQVIRFAKEVYADPYHPQKMRSYAEEYLDWSVKMEMLKEFLEDIVEK